MCRITGLYSKNKIKKKVIQQMRDAMAYGGPDAANLYINQGATVALGHRRLSILDLSEAGTQPMRWKNWVIVFNGEIYNFQEIKKEMPEFHFETGTDSEVILKAFEKWGLECVHRFRGMFAFALWDENEEKLLLCRDRVGVKPMYWYEKDGLFLFASELKAFHEHPEFDKTIDTTAVSLFLQQGYIPSPHCIFKYAHKLKPGHFLEVSKNKEIKEIMYWEVSPLTPNGGIRTKPEKKSFGDFKEELEGLLIDSFKLRMVADVPVGMFLSGGVDSSLVTALLQKNINQPVKTFTIGFDDPTLNEAHFAKAISNHLETDHTELYCTEEEFKSVIPKLPEIYDEPFGDSSGIPTYLVAKLAKEQVKVSLSADGGDELFGGYTKYEFTKKYFQKINRIPYPIRKGLGKLIHRIDPAWMERNSSVIPFLKQYAGVGNKFSKLQNAFDAKDITAFFNIVSSYLTPKQLRRFYPYTENRFLQNGAVIDKNHILSYLGMIDIKTYLEGDIMTKVDRATMQVALEGREPFLDHHLIEYSQRLPDHFKIRGNSTKFILREILYKYVPKELIERPKQGFAIPIRKWLMTILSEQLLSIKEDQSFFDQFQLNKKEINQSIDDFLANSGFVNPHFIWFVFTLHQWKNRWLK